MSKEMFSEKQWEMFSALKTDMQRDFIVFKLHGLADHEAYSAAGGTASNYNSQRVCAFQMANSPNVKALLDDIKKQKLNDAIMTREEMAAMLTGLATVSIDDIVDIHYEERELVDPETGELVKIKEQTRWTLKDFRKMSTGARESISELSVGRDGYKIKQHSQLAATKQLAELLGYNKPQQVEVLTPKNLGDFYNDD